MNDLLTDSFEIPRGQASRDGDIELGTQMPVNSGELGLESFFKKVQEIEKQIEKLSNQQKKLQDAHEESKSVTKASAMKGNRLLLIPGVWFMYMTLFATLSAVASLTFL